MIEAVFKGNQKETVAYGLWQYDYGQTLQIQGVQLPSTVQVHFALQAIDGEATTEIGTSQNGITEVKIPDALLKQTTEIDIYDRPTYTMYAWVYTTDGKFGKTEYRVIMPISKRAKPKDYNPEEETVTKVFDQIVAKMDASATKAENAANHATETAEEIKADREKITTNEIKIAGLKSDLVAQNSIYNGGMFDYVYNLLDGREWKHGSWSSSKPTDVSNRITTGIINIAGLPPIFPVHVQDGYLWNYYAFDGTAVGAGSAWKESGDFNFANAGNPTKISILMKNKDDSEIINVDDVASKISVVFSLFDSFYKDLQMINSGSLADYKNLTGFYGCVSSSISNITDLPPNVSTGFILRNEQIKNGNIVFGTFQIVQSRYGEIATRFITTSGVADDWTILRTKSIEMISIGDSIPLGTYSWFDDSAQWGHLSSVDTKVSYVQQMCNIKGIINKNYCHGGLGWIRAANDGTLLKPLLDTTDFTSVNYVYMQLGTNDWNYSFPLGETTDTKDTDTVCGHIRYAIEYIYAKNPLIKLCVALPFNRAPGGASYKYNWGYGALNSLSKTLKDYCDAIKTICNEYGVQYIDWTTNSAIGRLNIKKMLPDGTHPSIQTHEILGHELAGRIPFN